MTPRTLANAALDESPENANRRTELAEYLNSFMSWFSADILVERLVNVLTQVSTLTPTPTLYPIPQPSWSSASSMC